MFNSSNGKTASDKRIEDLSDLFAADFDDVLKDPSITRDQKEQLIAKLSEVVANRDSAKEFATGTYAQNSLGRPAAALSAGTTTPPSQGDIQGALNIIGLVLTARGAGYEHQVKLVRRALSINTDPDFVEATDDGTPKAIKSLTSQVNGYRDDRDLLDWLVERLGARPLASDQHYNVAGSKTSLTSFIANIGNGVNKTELERKITRVRAKVESITGGLRPGIVLGKDEAITAIEAVEDLVS